MEFDNNSDEPLSRRARKRVPHYELTSRMQRYRNQKSIERRLNEVQNFCSRIGLVITSVTIKRLRTERVAFHNDESILIDNNNLIESENSSETSIGSIEASLISSVNPIVRDKNLKIEIFYNDNFPDQELEKEVRTIKALVAKDEANCSDVGYDKFMKAFKMDFDFPSLDEIKTLRRQLSRVFKVENNLFGVYNSCVMKITYVCSSFIQNYGPVYNNELTIKLTGDGVNLSKKGVKLLNFAFNIIDDNANPMSIKGTYVLGK
jgi:hypothetical protein